MNLRWAAAGLMGLVLGCSCGSSNSATSAADASVKHDLLRGVAVNRKRLETQLGGIVASLRGERGSTTAVERARKVALAGFQLTRKGVRSQLDFSENDRGEVAAAARDARRADRYLGSGADRLRLAGLALGIQIGMLDGY
jgi:hypothetical protein